MDAFVADVEDDVITPAVARDTEEEERGGEQGGNGEEQGADQYQHHHQRAAPEIKAIDRSSVARICSGQVCYVGLVVCKWPAVAFFHAPTLPHSLPSLLSPL